MSLCSSALKELFEDGALALVEVDLLVDRVEHRGDLLLLVEVGGNGDQDRSIDVPCSDCTCHLPPALRASRC